MLLAMQHTGGCQVCEDGDGFDYVSSIMMVTMLTMMKAMMKAMTVFVNPILYVAFNATYRAVASNRKKMVVLMMSHH